MRRIAVLDAPSNLGLRPPTATSVPGCAKAPGALRDNGLLTRLGARDAGCLTPPRYDPGDWRPGDGVAQATQIAEYSRRLADRIGAILDAGEFPVILGGDCSILLGSGLAMHRLGEAVGGRIGLVFVDGHSDFRHPGNASYVGAAAGEDLALVTGRGQPDLASIEGRRPYFRDVDVVVMGLRAQDEYRLDLQAAGIVTRPVPALRAEGAARSAQWAREQLVDCAGYWLHVDVDVLDPAVMPAVDAPSPGGIAFPELEILLAGLVESPHCLGVEITVFDPDYDPDGLYAAEIAGTVASGLAAARAVTPRPDLIAARADLARPARLRPAAAPATDDAAIDDAAIDDAATDAAADDVAADDVAADDVAANDAAADGAASYGVATYGAAMAEADTAPLPRPAAEGGIRRLPRPAVDLDTMPLSRPDAGRGRLSRPAVDLDTLPLSRPAADRGMGRLSRPALDNNTVPLLRPTAEADATPSDETEISDLSGEGNGEGVSAEVDGEGGGHDVVAEPEPAAETVPMPEAALIVDPEPALDSDPDPDPEPALDSDPDRDPAPALDSDPDPDPAPAEERGSDLAPAPAVGSDPDAGPASALGAGPDPDPGSDPASEVDALDDVVSETAAAEEDSASFVTRPLGQAPLLDSEPLPATRPGMLRPRAAEERSSGDFPAAEGFSLPSQRPAFDLGSGSPADIA